MKHAVLLLVAPASLAWSAPAQQADLAPRVRSPAGRTPVVRPTVPDPSRAVLYVNGTYITQTGVGFGGADVSEIEPGSATYGYGDNQALAQRIADDFTIHPGSLWNVDSLIWHGYQTGAPTTGTLTGITVEALDAAPSLGGQPLAGDTTTNRLVSQTWTGVYRVQSTTLLSDQRAILDVEAELSAFPMLPWGTYWLSVDMAGSLSSGPWCPPTVPSLPGDNAEQLLNGTWAPIVDAHTLAGHDMWFQIQGPTCCAPPGTMYCFGIGCPCGNDAPDTGCTNSTGAGALLSGFGLNSLAAANLGLEIADLPPGTFTLIAFGSQPGDKPFKDGKLCLGGTIWRLWKHFNSGPAGAFQVPGLIDLCASGSPPIVFAAGETWYFQAWYRDPPVSGSTCGLGANLSNGYSIAFTP